MRDRGESVTMFLCCFLHSAAHSCCRRCVVAFALQLLCVICDSLGAIILGLLAGITNV